MKIVRTCPRGHRWGVTMAGPPHVPCALLGDEKGGSP
jgi:hypothetical protein